MHCFQGLYGSRGKYGTCNQGTLQDAGNVTKNFMCEDFPGGPVVKTPPCNARDVGLIPGHGTKIPHAAEQLSPHATSRECVNFTERCRVPQLRPNTAK